MVFVECRSLSETAVEMASLNEASQTRGTVPYLKRCSKFAMNPLETGGMAKKAPETGGIAQNQGYTPKQGVYSKNYLLSLGRTSTSASAWEPGSSAPSTWHAAGGRVA